MGLAAGYGYWVWLAGGYSIQVAGFKLLGSAALFKLLGSVLGLGAVMGSAAKFKLLDSAYGLSMLGSVLGSACWVHISGFRRERDGRLAELNFRLGFQP